MKITNTVLILTLIGIAVFPDAGYSLRTPIGNYGNLKEVLNSQDQNKNRVFPKINGKTQPLPPLLTKKSTQRSKEQIKTDRDELKTLLDQGKYTVKELSESTGIPEQTVKNDTENAPELKNHPNLIIADRKRRTKKQREKLRAKLKTLLGQGEYTVKDLSELTGMPEQTVKNDIASVPELKNHSNLIITEPKRRTKEQREEDRAKLKTLLDQGNYAVKELSKLVGMPEEGVKNDIAGVPRLKNHPNLIITRRVSQRIREQRERDRTELKNLLDQGKHTVKDLSKLTGIHEENIRNDMARISELRNHPNLIITGTEHRTKKSIIKVQWIFHGRLSRQTQTCP